jgi:hypothetical protein
VQEVPAERYILLSTLVVGRLDFILSVEFRIPLRRIDSFVQFGHEFLHDPRASLDSAEFLRERRKLL